MAFGKWLGGILGWSLGGPIGALMGFAFGSLIDGTASAQGHNRRIGGDWRRDFKPHRHQTTQGDFVAGVLVLSAAVMKADGKLLKSELDYIRDFFEKQFGKPESVQQIQILKELLKKDIPIRQVCEQLNYFMEHSVRLQILQYLFGIADADGHVHPSEEAVIRKIAGYLRISQRDYSAISSMFYQASPRRKYKSPENAYKILGVSKFVKEPELKKAYRRMVKKYHPDVLKNIGEAQVKAAEEKFIQVQKAYEQIKKEKGWN